MYGAEFLLALHSNYGPFWYHFRDKARYFFHTPCIRHPRQGGLRRNIAIMFGVQKLDWCVSQTVKKSLRICSLVSTQYVNVTDTQTDGQTQHDGIASPLLLR